MNKALSDCSGSHSLIFIQQALQETVAVLLVISSLYDPLNTNYLEVQRITVPY